MLAERARARGQRAKGLYDGYAWVLSGGCAHGTPPPMRATSCPSEADALAFLRPCRAAEGVRYDRLTFVRLEEAPQDCVYEAAGERCE